MKTGTFSIAAENRPVPGCTVSGELIKGVYCYSLAAGTDISAELYPYHKFIYMLDGDARLTGAVDRRLIPGKAVCAPTGVPLGVETTCGAVYIEFNTGRCDNMNDAVKAGEVFKLAELVPYQDGKIVNMDIVHNDAMKFVVMAFDAGTGLTPHAAPGDALIFALDGEGVIGYEGKEYPIKAGENFRFARGGMHSVTAEKRFKMALLLTLK